MLEGSYLNVTLVGNLSAQMNFCLMTRKLFRNPFRDPGRTQNASLGSLNEGLPPPNILIA